MLAFNFFFLPPLYTFTIADPQNWVALVVFLVVAVIASQLSSAAKERARDAVARRQEVTRLFDLSRDILLTTEKESALPALVRHIARRFELESVAIAVPTDQAWTIYEGGERNIAPDPARLDEALARLRGPLKYDRPGRRTADTLASPEPTSDSSPSSPFVSAPSRSVSSRPTPTRLMSERSMRLRVWRRLPSNGRIFCTSAKPRKRIASGPISPRRCWPRSATISGRR